MIAPTISANETSLPANQISQPSDSIDVRTPATCELLMDAVRPIALKISTGPIMTTLMYSLMRCTRLRDCGMRQVKFSACSNTHKKMTQLLGKPPVLNSSATMVSAGVVRIIDLENQGYKLIKP